MKAAVDGRLPAAGAVVYRTSTTVGEETQDMGIIK